MKYHQLSLFSDKHIDRSPLCRMYYHPSRYLINRLRLEVYYNVLNPTTPWILGSFNIYLLFMHRNGKNRVKIKGRYFYDPINNQSFSLI